MTSVKNIDDVVFTDEELEFVNQSKIARHFKITSAYVNMILRGKRKSKKYGQPVRLLAYNMIKQAA